MLYFHVLFNFVSVTFVLIKYFPHRKLVMLHSVENMNTPKMLYFRLLHSSFLFYNPASRFVAV
jgi:hypothetical protein